MQLKISQLILVLFLFIAEDVSAYTNTERNFHKLTSQDGLSDNMVYCIHKDREGFMWFGTNNGLSRYDSYQFKNFPIRSDFSVSVLKIEETHQSMLYLLTNDWLTTFNCKNEIASPLNLSIKNRPCQILDFTLLNDSIIFACEDQYLLRITSLNKQQSSTHRIKIMPHIVLDKTERFMKLCLAKNKTSLYLVTSHGRILLFDINKNTVIKQIQLPVTQKEFGASSISCQNGYVWVTSMVNGIFICDLSLSHVQNLLNRAGSRVLSHNDVYNITSTSANSYLAITWYGYTIIHYNAANPQKWETEVFTHLPIWNTQNIEMRMISSYFDPNGILWIGTHGGGIIMSDWRWNFFRKYDQNSDNETRGIVADAQNRIYLATYERGIMRSSKLSTLQNSELDFSPIHIPEISRTYLCALKDKEGILWFGNKDGKLLRYDPSKDTYSIHPLEHSSSPIYALFSDSRNRIWIGTENKLLIIDSRTHAEEEIPLDRINCRVLDIDEDKKGNIWVATSLGVRKINRYKTKWMVQKYETKIPANTAQAILAASDGHIYVGFKNGMGIISPNQTKISQFLTTHDGLVGNWINCLIEDQQGYIWIGSNSGITRYDKQQKGCYNYYNFGSNCTVSTFNGLLFWGGSKHIISFDPQQAAHAFESTQNNKVLITNFEVNNRPINIGETVNGQIVLNHTITYTDKISLSYVNRNFSLSFNNLSYSNGMQKYNYRLLPYQTEWTTSSDKERISYANLPSGTYTFEVKSVYPDKNNSETTRLEIIIEPSWTQTWIFRICCIILCIGIIFLLIRWQRKKHKRQQHIIELEHELAIANMMRHQEKVVREERENFFTCVAHELRTPLTLILAPLTELLQQRVPANQINNKLLQIHKSAQSLRSIVTHLLQVQKIEAGMEKLTLSEADILKIIDKTCAPFTELAITQGLHFEMKMNYTKPNLWIDVVKIESAIQNLLSNAFKYSSQQGIVTLSVFSDIKDEKRYCVIQITDNGAGISEKLQKHIFDSFITGTNSPNTSTPIGIGLYIVKHTMDIHHGMVTLESKENEGSQFTLYIPEGNEHFTNDSYEKIPFEYESINTESINEHFTTTDEQELHSPTRPSLLIIEDNEEMRAYIISLFSDDYQVYEASDGEEGVEKAEKILPDLIISDVMMPIKNGFECCEELRSNSNTAHIPIIMLSAKVEDSDIIQATRVGTDDYLTKPFNPEVLKAKVRNLHLQREQLKRIYSKSLMLKSPLNEEEEAPLQSPFMQRVINVIETNLTNEAFNAKVLASTLNMSQATLYRRIKENCQLSIIEVIRNVRISKAATLLLLQKHSATEVAELVGYNDYDTFRKHFTKQFRVPPSQYGIHPKS